MGLDDLLAEAPDTNRRRPAEGAIEKILAARKLGWSYRKIAAAYADDYGEVVHREMISRWVHEAK